MRKVKLEILAKDIEESRYTIARDCAITRALHRAGINAIHDGIGILEENEGRNYIATNDDFQEAHEKVTNMYAAAAYEKEIVQDDEVFFQFWNITKEQLLKPEDFSFEVELNI